MNLLNILKEIEEVDPEFTERINPRRAAIKNMTSFGSKVTLAALPFALGGLFKKAYGQDMATINGVLNFALTLEYLEAEFYKQGVAATGLIDGADKDAIGHIATDEANHVTFLKSVLGTAAVKREDFSFDFTAKGTFPTVFSDYNIFLAVAETFEDTGVRAYKGQAPNLLGQDPYLTAALSIHSVEARHASYIRFLRSSRGASIKPWITGANDTGLDAVAASYAGEDNVMQGGVDITTLSNGFQAKISTDAATEAFDEPLTKDQVLAIVMPFIN